MESKEKTTEIDNSAIVKKTLMALITVATPKTSSDYAWSSLKLILRELKTKHDFLRYVKIGDLKSLSYSIDDIKVLPEINSIGQKDLGLALQDLIDLLKERLGKKAGYFFLQEFKNILGKEYYSILKSIGVDLRLIELRKYVQGLGKEYMIRDDRGLNIAFIEKTQ